MNTKPKTDKRYKKVERATFIKLTMKIASNKEEIQRKLNTGEIDSISELAKLEGVPVSTMATLCKELEIVAPLTRIRKEKVSPSLGAIITVIHRICQELKIDDTEIKPYLYEPETKRRN